MGNVLEFALGLQASEFISKLGLAGGELLSFAAVGEAVRKSWEHTWEAIDQGAELKGLSSATGESVDQLYRFQQGLQAIGGQTESLPMFFMLVQKALSGVNDQGMRTNILFSRLGLDINQLKSEDGVKALTDIAGALGRINSNQSAGIAEQLFGRFQAETVLQMARNMKEFQEGMNGSSNTGALLQKFADTFEQVKADWQIVENDVLGIWVAVAGYIAPEFKKMFKAVHDDIKNIGPALSGAIQGAHVEEFMNDAMAAAFEQGGYYGSRILSALAVGFGDALTAALKIAIEQMIPMWWNGIMHAGRIAFDQGAIKVLEAKNTADQWALEHTTGKGTLARETRKSLASDITSNNRGIANLADMIDSEMQEDSADFHKKLSDAMASLGTAMQGAIGDVEKDWASTGGSGPHAALDRLRKLTKAMAAAGTAGGDASSGTAGISLGNLQSSQYKMEFTSLEKMGFVMKGGAGNPFELRKIDLLQRIVENTATLHPNHPLRGGGAGDVSGVIHYYQSGGAFNAL